MTKSSQFRFASTIGLDVGDRKTHLCAIDERRKLLVRDSFPTTREGLEKALGLYPRVGMVLEAGSQSPWMSRMLDAMGFQVHVVDPRRVQLISRDPRKTDRRDAEMLARLGASCPELLGKVRHRGAQAQADLAVIRARDLLVRMRTRVILQVRGFGKAFGHRFPACSAGAFPKRIRPLVPEELRPAIDPQLDVIAGLTAQIRDYEHALRKISAERYPETQLLEQVRGVGPLTATAFVLTLEDAGRFEDSRQVGSWLGLCPRSQASGEKDPDLPISKAGDGYLRRLLVQCACYILGPLGTDSDLRRFGQRLIDLRGRAGKKRARIAVARKLAVLLHRLWVTGELYEPLRDTRKRSAAAAA